jgi:hypothetical protein
MPTHYVLVDFENVQPENLAILAGGAFKVKVFIGAAQAKGRISFELSHSIQMLGASAEYVRIARSGPNAMDMHIAYYLGKLLEQEPRAEIDVISRDTDFDPLLEFLRAQEFKVRRVKAIAEVAKHVPPAPRKAPARAPPVMKPAKHAAAPKPAQKPAAAARQAGPDNFEAVVKQLRSMSGKPANRGKLAQAINAYLAHHGGSPGAKAVEQIIDELIRRKLVTPVGTKLNYTLG